MKRYLSTFEGVNAWISSVKPKHSFSGNSRDDWSQWRGIFAVEMKKLLGPEPKRVPLDVEVIYRKDCGEHYREKIIYNTEAWSSQTAFVLIPKNWVTVRNLPAVLAAHGHNEMGKNALVGLDLDENEWSDCHNAFALKFVKAGFVVIAPDWRGFGERSSPEDWVVMPHRDPCDANYEAEGYRGFHLLNLDVMDGMRTIDYLISRPEVDADRIGCAGLSFGGTMTTYLAAFDERIKVACISGYLSTLAEAMNEHDCGNFCGSQYMPGLYTIGDIPDVAGLIAPRPLIIEMGEKDVGFIISDQLKAYDHLSAIYNAAGASENLQKDHFPGAHEFNGKDSIEFFSKFL